MELYAGIDLHSNNSVVTVLDEQDRTVYAKRLPNDLGCIVAALRACAGEVRGVAVEVHVQLVLAGGRPSSRWLHRASGQHRRGQAVRRAQAWRRLQRRASSGPPVAAGHPALVLEVPPKVLGTANDMWQRWVVDVGITGPDKGAGGKYLFLPPGHKGAVPKGYHVVRSPTFGLWVPWRSFLVDGDPKPGVEGVKKFTKIYPLADAAKAHPPLNFVDMSGKPFNTIYPADYAFWELLNQVVQEEPTDSLDPVRLGFFQAIGIQKGKPFAPDERMKKILTEAAAVGDATARAKLFHTRSRDAYYYADSNWQLGFTGGYKFQTEPGVLNLDAANYYYFLAILVTPAMEEKLIGKGSQYAWTARDSNGNPLDGGKNYRLRMPPNVPVSNFWSVILYSDQTRSMIQTDQRSPSVSSQTKGLQVNADGSIDVWFGPKALPGKETNWVQTVPGRGWNTVLRMYGALEPWFNKTWRPGEIELQP